MIAWYAKNAAIYHPKLKPMAVGLMDLRECKDCPITYLDPYLRQARQKISLIFIYDHFNFNLLRTLLQGDG